MSRDAEKNTAIVTATRKSRIKRRNKEAEFQTIIDGSNLKQHRQNLAHESIKAYNENINLNKHNTLP